MENPDLQVHGTTSNLDDFFLNLQNVHIVFQFVKSCFERYYMLSGFSHPLFILGLF